MNTTIDTHSSTLSGTRFQTIDGSDNDVALNGEKRVNATRRPPVEARTQQEHGGNSRTQTYRTPTKPRETVTLREAQDALNQVLNILNSATTATPATQSVGTSTSGSKGFTLAGFENMTPEQMNLALTQLCVTALGDTAKLKSLGLEIREKGAEALRLRQNEDLRKQIDDSIKQQQQAQKSGKASEIIDWIVGVAEVISGVVKMAVGDELGGAADLAAGCAGLVKAYAEHMEQEDPANADKWKKIAEDAGKVQLAFEIIGAAVDLMSVGKGVMAAKSVAKGASTALAEASGAAISAAMEIGGDIGAQATKNVIKAFAMEVADNVAATVARQVSGPLAKNLSKQAIERLVAEAAEKAVQSAIKSGAKVTAESISKQIVRQIAIDCAKLVAKTVLKSTGNTIKAAGKTGGELVNTLAQNDIHKQSEELKKLIRLLMAEGDFMQFLLDDFQKMKKHQQDDMKDLVDSASKGLSGESDQIQSTGAALSHIAAQVA